jgi:hypothetical protein
MRFNQRTLTARVVQPIGANVMNKRRIRSGFVLKVFMRTDRLLQKYPLQKSLILKI